MPNQRGVLTTAALAVVATVVVIGLVSIVGIFLGAMPANADDKPGTFERWVAHASLEATLDREVKRLRAPAGVATDSTMVRGIKLYGTNCAVCHGTSDAQPSNVAEGLYQHPPQFAKHGVSDDPIEETYWKITHGIRLTGMPAYVKTLKEEERWAIASFLRYQDSLPPAASAAWKALPSAASPSAASPSAASPSAASPSAASPSAASPSAASPSAASPSAASDHQSPAGS